MLKQISVSDLRLGMHLHELSGAWLDHPFWKTKFVLQDPLDIEKLRASSVTECWIDTSKGLDVAPVDLPSPGSAKAVPAAASAALPAVAEARPEAPVRVSLEEELGRATALVKQSRRAVMSLFNQARMGKVMDADACVALVGDITESVWRNPGAMISLARLKTHDDYSYMHSVAVCALMVSLARQLGRDETEGREAGMAGLLHDMGKAVMPLLVLNKPGKLTDEEYRLMKTHPRRGHDLLLEGRGVPALALDVCLHHHERPDGKGYPLGLATGPALTLAARMGAVCDVYDAITSNRPYKSGWDPAESIARMAQWSKEGQFDPAVFAAFVKSLGIYPTGSLVRLESGRLAVVIEQNESSFVKPRVKVFFSTRSQLPVALEVIDLSQPGCTERIVGRESNAEWKFGHLDQLWSGQDAMVKSA
jgi:HD-GYP domain-containing protein (c-di-GMP phosphodiesterase class II)